MSLHKFKSNLKSSTVIIFLIVYGLGFFLLGKNSSLVNSIKIKGVKTQKAIDTPLNSPIPAADTQTATITAAFVKLCANTVYGFEVSYPKDYFTTYNTEDQKCAFFAPYSFVVPYDTTTFQIPIKIEVIKPADWGGEVNFAKTPNDFQNIVSVEDIDVNGKSVKKIDATLTGEGSTQKGFVKTTYMIFDDKNPLIVSYVQQDAKDNVDSFQKVLEEMVHSVNYF
ncbi:MAG TPA: hypothetical protein VLE91_04925 [Candidatus Saccharimonadales bacterium]|nr:hypothetical protein [Candidatus Saccharimonadales bacterium]